MRIEINPELRADIQRTEAEARGLAGRFASIAAAREEDGLERLDAELDAAAALGLDTELDDALEAALEALEPLELEHVTMDAARGEMPRAKHEDARAHLWLPAGSIADACTVASRLAALLADDPDRSGVALAVGLGGSGGCAQGCDLPEDAPPGPLFERR